MSRKDFTETAFKHTDCSHEIRPWEMWVGNVNVEKSISVPLYLDEMKTVRLGEQAYDIKGKPLPRSYCRPLIIAKAEYDVYDRIMMARLKD